MIPLDMKDYVSVVTAEMVDAWRRNGYTDVEMIRAESMEAAAYMVHAVVEDAWEQESYMAEMERGIDRAISQRPKG